MCSVYLRDLNNPDCVVPDDAKSIVEFRQSTADRQKLIEESLDSKKQLLKG